MADFEPGPSFSDGDLPVGFYNRDLLSPLIPGDILAFIKNCISSGRVRWTYHVTMRLQERRLNGEVLSRAVATFEIIEAYASDKYLPSFLLRGEVPEFVFHAPAATRRRSCSCGNRVSA